MAAVGRRLDSLTGLRFVAAFAVFCGHAMELGENQWPISLDRLVGQAGTAVSFFFVLSGFVLAWSARDGDRPSTFYRRRVARIYPAYLLAVLLAAVTMVAVLHEKLPVAHLVPVVLLVQSWVPHARVYFTLPAPELTPILNNIYQQIFTHSKTVEQALAGAEKQANEVFRREAAEEA